MRVLDTSRNEARLAPQIAVVIFQHLGRTPVRKHRETVRFADAGMPCAIFPSETEQRPDVASLDPSTRPGPLQPFRRPAQAESPRTRPTPQSDDGRPPHPVAKRLSWSRHRPLIRGLIFTRPWPLRFHTMSDRGAPCWPTTTSAPYGEPTARRAVTCALSVVRGPRRLHGTGRGIGHRLGTRESRRCRAWKGLLPTLPKTVPSALQDAPMSPYDEFDAGAPLDYFLPGDSREAIGHAEQVIEFVQHRLS